jgi:hypothetical protein
MGVFGGAATYFHRQAKGCQEETEFWLELDVELQFKWEHSGGGFGVREGGSEEGEWGVGVESGDQGEGGGREEEVA